MRSFMSSLEPSPDLLDASSSSTSAPPGYFDHVAVAAVHLNANHLRSRRWLVRAHHFRIGGRFPRIERSGDQLRRCSFDKVRVKSRGCRPFCLCQNSFAYSLNPSGRLAEDQRGFTVGDRLVEGWRRRIRQVPAWHVYSVPSRVARHQL